MFGPTPHIYICIHTALLGTGTHRDRQSSSYGVARGTIHDADHDPIRAQRPRPGSSLDVESAARTGGPPRPPWRQARQAAPAPVEKLDWAVPPHSHRGATAGGKKGPSVRLSLTAPARAARERRAGQRADEARTHSGGGMGRTGSRRRSRWAHAEMVGGESTRPRGETGRRAFPRPQVRCRISMRRT